MKFKAKNRMALVNRKNMKRLTGYFVKEGCVDLDLSEAVNYLVDIALGELEAIERDMACDGCGFAVQYNCGDKIYYCDHADRTDDMGKLSIENLVETSCEWCPLRDKK